MAAATTGGGQRIGGKGRVGKVKGMGKGEVDWGVSWLAAGRRRSCVDGGEETGGSCGRLGLGKEEAERMESEG